MRVALACWMLLAFAIPNALHAAGEQRVPARKVRSNAQEPIRVAQADADIDVLPLSKDELFGTDAPISGETSASAASAPRVQIRGFSQLTTAYTYASPTHWSRGVLRTQVEALGEFSPVLKWKASARLDIDPIIGSSNFYPDEVSDDQRYEFMVRETYLDTTLGDWEFRLGRQQIVWGEVVGLFFADVVSARDLRDFILPEFDIMRIPQWAARAEYFGTNSHLELIWIPFPSYDDIGKPGAEFYPLRLPPIPGVQQHFLSDDTPARTLSNTNYGVRASHLYKGWDMAAFYYSSMSSYPTFYRQMVAGPNPTVEFTPRHDRIWQAGATVTKDFASVVLRGESIFTANRGFEVTDMSDPDGVVEQDTLDYILSFDFVPFRDGHLNVQAFQRVFFDHDSNILFDRLETGLSLLIGGKLSPRWEPEFLIIQNINQNDRMLRPRIKWYPVQNATVIFGVDIFSGPDLSYFGRYDDRDRVYVEARYAF